MFLNIFVNIWEWLDKTLNNLFGLDNLINELVGFYFDLHSLFRVLIFAFLAIILVLGIISFVKKLLKIFIVLVVLFAVYLLFIK